MDFLDVGWQEILLILAVVLVIFGPGRMVEISRTLGRMFRNLKNMGSTLTKQVSNELQGDNNPPSPQDKGDKESAKP